MARGGGTGSRTNKKKKSDVGPQNGSVEVSQRPLKTPQTNGAGGDADHQTNIKHKNKHSSRKQKEETPPVPVVEEDTKEEKKEKLVPTSEQLRLAQITQSQDNSMDPQRKAKISQVMDITGKTEDEVATALFDCGWDASKAVEMLLDEGVSGGMGSWEETGKKKKKKNQEDEKTGKENEDWNDDFDPNNKFDDNRERSRHRGGPPRLRGRGGQSQGVPREEQGNWKARENQENDRNNFEGSGRGRGRGGAARGGRGGGPGGRGGGPVGGQRGGRGGGARAFGERGPMDSRVVERREAGPGAPGEARGGGGGGSESFGQIDTWNPVGEQPAEAPRQAPGPPGPVQAPGPPGLGPDGQPVRRPRPSNKDAFDNAGNWGDDFPAAEDWDNDEYTGSLSDTKVFTPSGAAGPKSGAIGEPVNGEARPAGPAHAAQAPGTAAPTPANNSLSGSSYSQPIDISALLQKPGGLTGAAGGATLSQYNVAATKDLKSAIGLAPGQGGALSYSSASSASAPGSSFASAAPGSAFSPIKPAAVTNGSNSASKALPRARLPPPSKIPSSAVEMPGDSLSNLDVQFGGLDLQFGGSNNDNGSSNFDFGAGTPTSQKQDLEKERPRTPPGLARGSSGPPAAKPEAPQQRVLSQGGRPQHLAEVEARLRQEAQQPRVPAPGRPQHPALPQPLLATPIQPIVEARPLSPSPPTRRRQTSDSHRVSPGRLSAETFASPEGLVQVVRFSSIPPGKPDPVPSPLDSYKAPGGGGKEVNQTLSSALASQGIKQSSSTDSVPGYGRVGERDPTSASRPGEPKSQYGQASQQRSPGPLLAKAENLGYNNGPSYSGYQGGKAAGQGFPSGQGYPGSAGGFERQGSQGQGYGHQASNGLSGGYSRGGGSSGYNPPREPSYSNSSYGGGGQGGGTFGPYGGSGASTTNYSPYTGNSSYSSASKASSQSSQSQYAPASTSSGPGTSQFPDSTSQQSGSKPSFDSTTSTSSGLAYGGVGPVSSSSNVSSLGLSANSMVSSSSKMSVNTTSGKMVPGMPPGVAGVLPAQYMIGANAAAGFPAYLANLGQAPAMAAYGYGGVGGHQLEDLAALQRSTLAASLPQLPNSGYYDPTSQFGGGSGGASSLASRPTDPASSFPSDSSGKFGSAPGDSTSSPVPSSVAPSQQPTPFNALSTFAAAAPAQQHPALPPGYAYFYGGVGGMGAQLAAAYGAQGLAAPTGYPATHPGIPAPTVAGPTNTTQFQKQAYGSSYGNTYGDSLSGLQSNSGYGKNTYGQSDSQAKSNTTSNTAGHGYWSSSNGLW